MKRTEHCDGCGSNHQPPMCPPKKEYKSVLTKRPLCIHKWIYIGPEDSYSQKIYAFYCEKCCKIRKEAQEKFIKSPWKPTNYNNGVDD